MQDRGGFHIDPTETVITGRFEWAYAPGKSFSREEARAVFSRDGIALKLDVVPFFGMSASFTFYVDAREKGVIGARASFDVRAVSDYVLGKYEQAAKEIGAQAESLQQNYEDMLSKYKGHMSSAQLLATFLRDLAGTLPGIAQAQAGKAAPRHFKDFARKKAKEQADEIATRLTDLAKALDKADAEHAKGLIIGLINEALEARIHISFVIKSYDTSIWEFPAAKPHRSKLERARDFVEQIPAEKLVAENAGEKWRRAVDKLDIARKIRDAVKGKGGAIPSITEIRWETTGLVDLTQASTVEVLATYQSKPMTLGSVPFRFDEPARSALGVATAIVNAIAAPPETRSITRRRSGRG